MKAIFVPVAVALCALLGGCAGSEISGLKAVNTFDESALPQAGSYYAQGKTLLRNGTPALAVEAFRKDIAREGMSVRALNGIAVAYQGLGRSDIAASYFQQAFALDPKSVETARNLSLLNYEVGQLDQSVRFAELTESLAEGTEERRPNDRSGLTVAANSARYIATLATVGETQRSAEVARGPQIERSGTNAWTLNVGSGPEPERYIALAVRESGVASAIPFPAAKPQPVSATSDAVEPDLSVKIVNVVGRNLMATRMGNYLAKSGVAVNSLANADHYHWSRSEIRYKSGARAAAEKIAKLLPVQVKLVEVQDGIDGVELQLGGDLLSFDATLRV